MVSATDSDSVGRGLWLRGVSVRDRAIKKPVRRRVIQTPKLERPQSQSFSRNMRQVNSLSSGGNQKGFFPPLSTFTSLRHTVLLNDVKRKAGQPAN